MSTIMWPPTCGTCQFFDAPNSLCRYNPPTTPSSTVASTIEKMPTGVPGTVPVLDTYWPYVDPANDWCGLWQQAGPIPPPAAPYYLYVWVGTGGTTTVPSVTEYPSQAAAQAAATQLIAAAPAIHTAVVPVGT